MDGLRLEIITDNSSNLFKIERQFVSNREGRILFVGLATKESEKEFRGMS